jgi:hypothetical protein
MNESGDIFYVTKQYDAMKQFFVDLDFRVPDNDRGLQIYPVFNQGRACPISIGSWHICLEECTDTLPSGPLYLQVVDIGVACLLRLREKYSVKEIGRVSWDPSSPSVFQVVPPDGGAVIFTACT